MFTFVSADTIAERLLAHSLVLRLPHVLRAENALAVPQVWLEGADVGLVHIVDEDRGHRNDLSRAGRHDSHQDEEKHGVLPGGAQQLLSHERGGESGGDVLVSEERSSLSRGESKVGEAHGGGQSEGDGEPDQPPGDEAPDSLQRLGRNGGLPVGLVTEHSS